MTITNIQNLFDLGRPVVKNSIPALYKEHTFHMSRAKKYTYNYAVMDDYIIKHYLAGKTSKAIASDLNELQHRIQYRIVTLRDLGLMPHKHESMTGEAILRGKYIKSWKQTTNLYKELMIKNPDALAG
tara:strand:+ start:110 stop:493 length:384 start_codon:yes stop_codon:yes gene_type:complete